ncbi:outer membrane beta-barrel protein [bacterium]|jgi:hypothetical protein|nr:outer membrane beta-barrel protein [bacterium]
MKFFSLFLLFMLPLSLIAKDSEWFIGIEGGISEAKFSSKSADSGRVFSPQYGLKFGLRKEHVRYYIGYNQNNSFGTDLISSKSMYFGIDGLSDSIKVAAKTHMKLFLGAHMGAADSVIYGTAATDQNAYINDPNVTAFMAGFQTGVIFLLPANFEIELAYRHYLLFNSDKTDFNSGTFYGGLNYEFYAF